MHLDLKPANVMLTAAGGVKVLDFGLAKAFEADGSPSDASPDISNSPTMMGATRTGMIMGTAAYMSPEQAAGARVDKRTDIWAFGVVLYEMLAGTKLFEGESVAHVLADVIRAEPDLDRLPAATPAAIRRLLRRCLHKKPEQRLRDIGDARLEIEEAGREAGEVLEAGDGFEGTGRALVPSWQRALPWGLAVAATLVATAFAVTALRPTPQPVARTLKINLGTSSQSVGSLSPDGTMLAFRGRDADADGLNAIVVHDFASGQDRVVHTLDGPIRSYWTGIPWSWDSSSIVVQYALRGADEPQTVVIPAAGGSSRIVKQDGGLPVWTAAGELVYDSSSGIEVLSLVDLQTRTLTEAGEGSSGYPRVIEPLADGMLLYAEFFSEETTRILYLDGDQSTLVREVPASIAGSWRYADGFLLGFGDDGLVVLPYDAANRTAEGAPWRLIPGISARSSITFSREGTMIYTLGRTGPAPGTDVVWVDRAGQESAPFVPAEDGSYLGAVWLSPDGDRLAASIDDAIWIYEVGSDAAPLRLPGDAAEGVAGWMPGGESLVVARTSATASLRSPQREVVFALESAEGLGAPRELLRSPTSGSGFLGATATLSPDGRHLVYGGGEFGRPPSQPLVVTIGADGTVSDPAPFPRTVLAATVRISPNGLWMAFVEPSETLDSDVWVASFPDASSPRRLGAGRAPFWSPSGRELYYRTPFDRAVEETTLMEVSVDPETGQPAGAPRVAVVIPYSDRPVRGIYAVDAGGERFLVARLRPDEGGDEPVYLVEDWTRLLPEGMRRR